MVHEEDGCTCIPVQAEAGQAEGTHYQGGVGGDIRTVEAVGKGYTLFV